MCTKERWYVNISTVKFSPLGEKNGMTAKNKGDLTVTPCSSSLCYLSKRSNLLCLLYMCNIPNSTSLTSSLCYLVKQLPEGKIITMSYCLYIKQFPSFLKANKHCI